MSKPNQIKPEFLGIHALNSFVNTDSPSRSVMFAGHIRQSLVIAGSTEKRIQSGLEPEFGKYTFSVKMPVEARVIKAIDRYPAGVGMGSIAQNPEIVVIYEDSQTLEIGCVIIPTYCSNHQYFGFKYNVNYDAINRLVPGAVLPKGLVFADSPSITANGGYKYGIELNAALMSHPAVSEDGFLISEDVLPRLAFKMYEVRYVEFGSSHFPLNLYGTPEEYKPFPEIGERIKTDTGTNDGLLMVVRNFNTDLAPVDMSVYDTMEPDYYFDRPVYVKGQNGRVVDIEVHHPDTDYAQSPSDMFYVPDKYSKALRQFYQALVDIESSIRRERYKKFGSNQVTLSPELHQLLVMAHVVLNDPNAKYRQSFNRPLDDWEEPPPNPETVNQRLNILYRKKPLDMYFVKFVIEYDVIPDTGFKLTDHNGCPLVS